MGLYLTVYYLTLFKTLSIGLLDSVSASGNPIFVVVNTGKNSPKLVRFLLSMGFPTVVFHVEMMTLACEKTVQS